MQDLFICRNHIFGFGFFVALFVAFFYSWLMTMGLITLLVWSCIIATEGLLMSLGAYVGMERAATRATLLFSRPPRVPRCE